MSNTTTRKQVQGRSAVHTIEVRPELQFASLADSYEAWKNSDLPQLEAWEPENRAQFKSVGRATAWISKLVKGAGWPQATHWIVQAVRTGHPSYAISVYLRN